MRTLRPAMSGIALPKLCKKARLRLLWSEVDDSRGQWAGDEARPVAWDDGPAWQFRLHFDLDDKGKNWLLTGRLHRSDETADVSRATMILPAGMMLLDDRLARVELGDGCGLEALALRKSTGRSGGALSRMRCWSNSGGRLRFPRWRCPPSFAGNKSARHRGHGSRSRGQLPVRTVTSLMPW